MCGIMGYVGKDPDGIRITLDGLGDLLHRGYDSIGLCVYSEQDLAIYRKSTEQIREINIGHIEELIPDMTVPCYVSFGHTRWASCGEVTDANAHPHRSGKFVVVQNGNVENYLELKNELIVQGFQFASQTDTEVIAHLFTLHYNGDLVETVKCVLDRIIGANALVIFCQDQPDKLVAVNRGGTLLIGKGEKGVVVASDPLALPVWVEKRIDLESNEVAVLMADSSEVQHKGRVVEKEELVCEARLTETLQGYETHMLREIFEQPQVLRNTMSGRWLMEKGISHLGGLSEVARNLRKARAFHFVGCGTAYYACQYAVMLLNRFGIPARAWVSSEFCYSHPVFDPSDVFVFISQSGETADSIAVLEEIKIKGNLTLGLVNVVDSKIARMTDAGVYVRAGVERGVASTKAYTAQLVTIVMLAIFLARQRKMTIDTGQKIIAEMETIPDKIEQILSQHKVIQTLAAKYRDVKDYYFLGRYFNFISAQEGSLKLKEISYVHSESYPLGEMKHGAIALIDSDFCSLVVAPRDAVYQKSLVNISEITARKGKTIAVTDESGAAGIKDVVDDVLVVPDTLEFLSPLLTAIPLQLFAYDMATELEKNPDKPRNLAKTVTVE